MRQLTNVLLACAGIVGLAVYLMWLGDWLYQELAEYMLVTAYAIVFGVLYQVVIWIQPRRR